MRAWVAVLCGAFVLVAAGCGSDDPPSTSASTRATVPTDRLSAIPLVTFTGPRELSLHVGEPTAVSFTITNASKLTGQYVLRASGSDGIAVQLRPTEVTLGARQSSTIDLTVTADRAMSAGEIDLVAARSGNPNAAWRAPRIVVHAS